MLKYETHLHTSPVSKCAKASVRESLEFYKKAGYAGVFITNHFIDGNGDNSKTYEEQIRYYFSDYEEGKSLEEEIGIRVFSGVEMTYKGTDFLVYGLDKAWYLLHPEIMDMMQHEKLRFLMEQGALVIQAHPFREASFIKYFRLFPYFVQGVEIINASNKELANQMAKQYAEGYNLIPFAGSDNHRAGEQKMLAGMESEAEVLSERDFVQKVLNGEMRVFCQENIW